MNKIIGIFEAIGNTYQSEAIATTTIIAVLLIVTVLSFYEFVVYRYVSHRNFYNKSLNISLAILPFFISTIILCLQSNIVVTLGTIGALAIIRFRTAIKDPVDMIYILWATYIGIICGCQLYEVAVLTSVIVTIVLILLNHISFGKKPFVLVIHTNKDIENELDDVLHKYSKEFRIKSRNYTSSGLDYAIELSVKNPSILTNELTSLKQIDKFSLIEYDADDIV